MRLDDGRDVKEFIPLPKPLAKKIKETKFTERERKMVDTVIEQTLGYEAFKDNGESVRLTSKPMSSRYLSILTNLPRSTVNYEVDRLTNRHIFMVENGWFKGQRTRVIGMNMNTRQSLSMSQNTNQRMGP